MVVPAAKKTQVRDLFHLEPDAFLAALPLLVSLLAVAFLSVRISRGIYLGDEGVACVESWRVAQGQVPVADFFDIIPPGSFYMLGGIFRLIGPTILASRLLGLVYGLLLVALVYALTARFARRPVARALALSFLIPFGVGAWPFPSHHWAVDLCQLAALWLLLKGTDSPSAWWPALGGLAAGAGAWCMQDQGGYAVLALSLFAVPVVGRGRRLRFGAAWFGGLAAAAVFPLALLLRSVSIGTLWRDWVVFPATRYQDLQAGGGALAGGWRAVLSDITVARLTVAPVYVALTVACYGLLFLLPWAALGAMAAAFWRRWLAAPRAALLSAMTLAFLGGAAHRWTIMNLVWAAPVCALWMGVAADRLWDAPRAGLRRAARVTAISALCLLCAFGVIGLFQQGLTQTIPVRGLAGTLSTYDAREAASLQAFLDAIGEEVPERAPAFTMGYIPMVGFMTAHPNPTPYAIFITQPPYNTPEQEERWVRAVEDHQVEWGFSRSVVPLAPGPASDYLLSHYSPAWRSPAFTLWRRRP